eukprot:6234232-Pyramimonas_sp.AAC.1
MQERQKTCDCQAAGRSSDPKGDRLRGAEKNCRHEEQGECHDTGRGNVEKKTGAARKSGQPNGASNRMRGTAREKSRI